MANNASPLQPKVDSSGPSPKAATYDGVDELDQLLDHLAQELGAEGGMLAYYGAGRPEAIIVHSSGLAGPAITRLGSLTASHISWLPPEPSWIKSADGEPVLVIPVESGGSDLLLLSLLFESGNKARTERAWWRHARLARTYLKLWLGSTRPAAHDRALENALDLSDTGVALIDGSARLLFANAVARELLNRGEGVCLAHGVIRPINLRDGVNFQAALAHLARLETQPEAGRATLLVFRRDNGPSLMASLVPTSAGGAVLFIVDPATDAEEALTPLCRLYGLSRVETELACRLVAGETIAMAAQKMRVKEQTARSYLKQIFTKTGVKRQTELIVMMLSRILRLKRTVRQIALGDARAEEAVTRLR